MQYVFDLDGVLVDSKLAVFKAYRAAGVMPPTDWWGQSWSQWGKQGGFTELQHQRKNQLYPAMLMKHGRALPLVHLFQQMHGLIVTSASHTAAYAALRFLGLFHQTNCVYMEMNREAKLRFLRGQMGGGIYFDDSLDTCEQVREIPQWTAIHVLS